MLIRNFVLASTLAFLTLSTTSCSHQSIKPEPTVVKEQVPTLVRVPDAHLQKRAPTQPAKGGNQKELDEFTRACVIAIERSDLDKDDIYKWMDETEKKLKAAAEAKPPN